MMPGLDAAALFRRLHEAGVSYIVVGGFAVVAHGHVRVTKDLDICPDPDPENLERLASLLRELDARQLGAEDFEEGEFPFDPRRPEELAEGGNFRLRTSLGDLDVMQWIPGVGEEHAYPVLAPDAVTAPVHGVPVRVCSLRHLRDMKRAAGRELDLDDLAKLAIAHPDEP